MRKVYGVTNLVAYLQSIGRPLTEEQVEYYLYRKEIPHLKLLNKLVVFNLDHIDWWIDHRDT